MVALHWHGSVRRFIALLAVAAMAASMAALRLNVKGFAIATEPDITFQPGDNPQGREPLTVGEGSIVARFIDTDNVGVEITRPTTPNVTIPLCGDPTVYDATINWGDGTATDTGTVDCDSSHQSQYAVFSDNAHTYADSGTYQISVTVDDRPTAESPADADTAQTATATVNDAAILAGTPANVTGTEGKDVTVTAEFNDTGTNETSIDSHLSAMVDWGDGTSSAGTISAPTNVNECECNVLVSATRHDYDARATKYSVSVTLTDDGGASKTSTLTATIADAVLTAGAAKSFTSTATQASSNVVASFTDAAGAQAAAADFTATIKWGDSTTSSGTVTKTSAGAFNVSGTHAYATAGTKTLTITVTDEEGQTLTMSATATVPALPATGQPGRSGTSGWPLLPTALILLGLVGMTAGLARMRLFHR